MQKKKKNYLHTLSPLTFKKEAVCGVISTWRSHASYAILRMGLRFFCFWGFLDDRDTVPWFRSRFSHALFVLRQRGRARSTVICFDSGVISQTKASTTYSLRATRSCALWRFIFFLFRRREISVFTRFYQCSGCVCASRHRKAHGVVGPAQSSSGRMFVPRDRLDRCPAIR